MSANLRWGSTWSIFTRLCFGFIPRVGERIAPPLPDIGSIWDVTMYPPTLDD